MLPLFARYPRLRSRLHHLELATLPTPLSSLDGLGRSLGRRGLFMKRDDLSGALYGGNKVRKLEFLLGDARDQGALRVVTSGAAGSNHALATALYAGRCGFRTTLMLCEQPSVPGVAANLAADVACGAEVLFDSSYDEQQARVQAAEAHYRALDGISPYLIPPGGSVPIGVVGFVNAALELSAQIDEGSLPMPDRIYVSFGTMGTAAGLLLGMRAVGLPSKLVAVRVTPEPVANAEKFRALFDRTGELLRERDSSFPRCSFDHRHFGICDDYLGGGYAIGTEVACRAIDQFEAREGIALDPVYTAKPAAAFLADAVSGQKRDRVLLYWHTKNSRPLPVPPTTFDYRRLPEGLHRYFAGC
ncbi:MAG: pyridoxal-phosphate dependent enzyme [Polyangiaceae bacterium]|nr:pyridoxal-phosphate dependent enzyme [Polyangiaceae bacterium]